jgi:ABC-type sugar transport system substrate-binding protein
MRAFLFLSAMSVASAVCGAAFAAQSDYSDIEVVAVAPRNPNMRPVMMSVPAEGWDKQAAKAGASRTEKLVITAQRIASKASDR